MTRRLLPVLMVLASVTLGAQRIHLRYVPNTCSGTAITTSDDLAAIAAAGSTGQTFCIAAGTHRLRSVTPLNGQRFIGTPGAQLFGSSVLTGWVSNSGNWYVTGQTQAGYQGYVGLGFCNSGTGCEYPEDLWFESTLKTHVTTLGAIGAGKWFFDYAADRIYVGDDPTGHTIETSITADAFNGSAVNVTIQGLDIERYASYPQHGTIHGDSTTRWVIQSNIIRGGHAVGVRIGNDMQLIGNVIDRNGQLGISGVGDRVNVQGNEISYNNTVGYSVGNEAGGTKFSMTHGLILRGNWSHHNDGIGIWTDISNRDCLYDGNTVDDNSWAGIMHEISFACIIRNNVIRRNGLTQPDVGTSNKACFVADSGILIAASSNVQVYGNYLEENADGICALQQDRSSNETTFGEASGAYRVRGLNVHDNYGATTVGSWGVSADTFATEVVDLTGTYAGGSDPVEVRQPAGTGYNNHFECNNYYLGSASGATTWWYWASTAKTFTTWQALGHESASGTACVAGGNDGTYAAHGTYVARP